MQMLYRMLYKMQVQTRSTYISARHVAAKQKSLNRAAAVTFYNCQKHSLKAPAPSTVEHWRHSLGNSKQLPTGPAASGIVQAMPHGSGPVAYGSLLAPQLMLAFAPSPAPAWQVSPAAASPHPQLADPLYPKRTTDPAATTPNHCPAVSYRCLRC